MSTILKQAETLYQNVKSIEDFLAIDKFARRRWNELNRSAARKASAKFEIGDRVSFSHPKRGTLKGTVSRIMEKNFKVKEDDGPMWRINPRFLKKIR